jgi:hypothetical protein
MSPPQKAGTFTFGAHHYFFSKRICITNEKQLTHFGSHDCLEIFDFAKLFALFSNDPNRIFSQKRMKMSREDDFGRPKNRGSDELRTFRKL